METGFSWLGSIGLLLVSGGLVSLAASIAYHEWTARRSRQRELEGLLYLLDLEIGHNQLSLSQFVEDPDSVTHTVGAPIQTTVWNEVKARVAYLLEDKEHFRTIASFYSILEESVLPVIEHKDMTAQTKRDFISTLSKSEQENAEEVQVIIHQYISVDPRKYSVVVSLPGGSDQ